MYNDYIKNYCLLQTYFSYKYTFFLKIYIVIYFITYTIFSPLIPFTNIIACGSDIIIINSSTINILLIKLLIITKNNIFTIKNNINASCSIIPSILGLI